MQTVDMTPNDSPSIGQVWVLPSPSGELAEVVVHGVDSVTKVVRYIPVGGTETQRLELHRFCAHFRQK